MVHLNKTKKRKPHSKKIGGGNETKVTNNRMSIENKFRKLKPPPKPITITEIENRLKIKPSGKSSEYKLLTEKLKTVQEQKTNTETDANLCYEIFEKIASYDPNHRYDFTKSYFKNIEKDYEKAKEIYLYTTRLLIEKMKDIIIKKKILEESDNVLNIPDDNLFENNEPMVMFFKNLKTKLKEKLKENFKEKTKEELLKMDSTACYILQFLNLISTELFEKYFLNIKKNIDLINTTREHFISRYHESEFKAKMDNLRNSTFNIDMILASFISSTYTKLRGYEVLYSSLHTYIYNYILTRTKFLELYNRFNRLINNNYNIGQINILFKQYIRYNHIINKINPENKQLLEKLSQKQNKQSIEIEEKLFYKYPINREKKHSPFPLSQNEEADIVTYNKIANIFLFISKFKIEKDIPFYKETTFKDEIKTVIREFNQKQISKIAIDFKKGNYEQIYKHSVELIIKIIQQSASDEINKLYNNYKTEINLLESAKAKIV